ncbi:zinc carboxypeptidase [Solenopsis invicta]|uniref:zinc carboxypeptidase n=1 Tax=Solenopsis invicta TaxID=13686 RepID=UPI000595921F|nr:zinc carboxypeptidase [Solenopsis invicta]
MWRITVLFIVTTGLAAAKVTYENYKLFRIIPTMETHLEVLQSLNNENGFSYWQEPSWINREALLMVSPHNLTDFYDSMKDFQATHELKIDNIQKLINNTIPHNQSQNFDFNSYHNISNIYNNLDYLHKKYPKIVKLIGLCCSYENRYIKGIKLFAKRDDAQTHGIFIDGGMHGREWISPATVMYILHQLLFSEDPRVRYIADNHNWYIFPVLNPDGYEYSRTHDRLWSKTRKVLPWFEPFSSTCQGSNLNRNWNFRWNTISNSSNPCNDNYPGNRPFSEQEIDIVAHYMSNTTFHAYISFQGFGQKLMIPHAYTVQHNFFSYDWLLRLCKTVINNLEQKFNTKYEIGTIGELDGLASGTSADYVANILRKHLVVVYKLRDDGQYGFLQPSEQIIPTGKEALEFLVSIFTEALNVKMP